MRYRRVLGGHLELSRIFTTNTYEVRFFIRTSCRNPRKIAMRGNWKSVQPVLVTGYKIDSVCGSWIDMEKDDYRCLMSILMKETETAETTLDTSRFIKCLREEITNKLDRGDEV